MVGSAIVRQLISQGHSTANIITRAHVDLDLTNQTAVNAFFAQERPEQVYLAAARVGGIHANSAYPADFIYQNLLIQANVINSAFLSGVKKLLFLGSSCIYPKLAPQPIDEDSLLTGTLEPTNEPYAIAKIAGIKMCESYNRQYGSSHGVDYRSIMPTNLFGPGDSYHPENSHVIPALIQRFHKAKIDRISKVSIWGTGTAKREFLYVDDMASACIFLMNLPQDIYQKYTKQMQSHINAGVGEDMTILQLAQKIAHTVGYRGTIHIDPSKPDGTPRKLVSTMRLNAMGWQPSVKFETGLMLAYKDFLTKHHTNSTKQ